MTTTLPANPFSDPTILNITGSTQLSVSTRFVIELTTSSGGYVVTVGENVSRVLLNSSAYEITIRVAKQPSFEDVILSPGEVIYALWDVGTQEHVYWLVLDSRSIIFSQTAIPASGSAAGLYSVQTGANRGLYMSSGVGAVYLIQAYQEDGDWPAV